MRQLAQNVHCGCDDTCGYPSICATQSCMKWHTRVRVVELVSESVHALGKSFRVLGEYLVHRKNCSFSDVRTRMIQHCNKFWREIPGELRSNDV